TLGLALARGYPANASTLAGQLSNLIVGRSSLVAGTQVPDTITPVITQLAAQATDFPVPPTTPGYVFAYNPTLGIWERSTGSLGPVFLERAETVGYHKFALGVSYLYGNVDSFDGSSFAQGFNTRVGIVAANLPVGPGGAAGLGEAGVTLDKFELPTS